MENEFNYYFIQRRGDQSYPLIKIEHSDKDERHYVKFMHLEFNTPMPRNPVLADFLSGANVFLSERIVEKIKELAPHGVRYIPTELTDPRGNKTDNYTAIIPADENYYEAMDKELSEFEYEDGSYWIDKLVLDKKVLGEIPLRNRLIFALSEMPGKTLFHKSVADAILELEPTGMVFVNIEEYEF